VVLLAARRSEPLRNAFVLRRAHGGPSTGSGQAANRCRLPELRSSVRNLARELPARTRGDQRVFPSASVQRDLHSGLSQRHGSHHRDRRDENLRSQLARLGPAALYGAARRCGIETGGRERGAPPGAEASAVTGACRRAPGRAIPTPTRRLRVGALVRGQRPDVIPAFDSTVVEYGPVWKRERRVIAPSCARSVRWRCRRCR